MWEKLKEYFNRIKVELVILGVLSLILFFLKGIDMRPIGAALLLYKVILFSASQIHALAMRKVLFGYIDFKVAPIGQQIMAIVLHASAAFVYATGG